MIGFVANRMTDMEVEGLTGASWNERSAAKNEPSQRLPRAGLGDARAGTVELAIPKLRKGSYFPLERLNGEINGSSPNYLWQQVP